jgi:hypothetical protein
MVETSGISMGWERRIRATKRGIIRAMAYTPEFTAVYVSRDIAEEIQASTEMIVKIGEDTTFELVPLKMDGSLPNQTVIYLWNEEK